MNAKVLVVLLAALIGASLWLAFGQDGAPVPVDAPAAAAPTAAPAPAAAPLVNAQGAVVDPAATTGERTAAALAQAPTAAGGGGMVRGRVVDAVGRPRAGVTLLLATWPSASTDASFLPDLPGRTAGAMPGKPVVRTDGEGRFAMPLAADRDGAFAVADAELLFAGAAPHVRGGKGDQDLGDVVVVRAAVVRGRVQDEAGKPIAGAKVAVERGLLGREDQGRAVSAADGSFAVERLQPGAYTLRAAVAGFVPHSAGLELQAEEQRDGVVVTLRTGQVIAGRVVDDRGVGVAGAKVGAKRKEVRAGMEVERSSADDAVTTDANGWFTLAGLAEDVVTVSAFSKEHTTATAADVALGTTDVVLRVERLGAIEGVLVGLDGAPIADSEVRLGAPTEDGGIDFGFEDFDAGATFVRRARPTRSGADGAYRLEGVRPGTVTVSAVGKGHRPARVDGVQVVAAQTTAGVRLVAVRGAVARVRVVDAAGAPVAGAAVRASRPQQRASGGTMTVSMRATSIVADGPTGEVAMVGGGPLGSGTTDADGRCELAALPAGDVEFTASHKDHAAATPTTISLPAAGGVDVALALRVPGFVAVTVLDAAGKPVAQAEVVIEPASGGGGGRRKLVTDAEGKATSPALAPGDYHAALARAAKAMSVGGGDNRVVFLGGEPDVLDGSRVAVAIAAGKTVEVALRQPVLARVHGVVAGADGPVAGCAVELARGGEARIPGFGGGSATTTGPDGAYAFDGVAAGEYTITYGREKAVVKAEAACVVPAGVTDVRLDLALRTGVVRLRALDEATGKPVAGADVEIQRVRKDAAGGAVRSVMAVGLAMMGDDEGGEGMTTMTFGAQKARTDEQGVAVFEDVPEGEWSLEVTHKSHARKTAPPVAVVERQTADAGDVQLQGAGALRGTVTAGDGGKPGMAMVECRRVGETKWLAPVMALGGRYRLPGLAVGRYELRARKADAGESAAGPIVEIEVKAGEATLVDLRTQ